MDLSWWVSLCSLCVVVVLGSNPCRGAPPVGEDNDETPVSYRGHKVLSIAVHSAGDISYLRELGRKPWIDMDFWNEPVGYRGSHVDIRIGPGSYAYVRNALHARRLRYRVKIDDIQDLIDGEKKARSHHVFHDDVISSRVRRSISEDNDDVTNVDRLLFYWFNIAGTYARYSQIKDWLYFAHYAKPDITSVFDIGESAEGRPLKVIKIGAASQTPKPAVWIDAGIHGREWISPATAIYIIDKLVDGYGHDSHITGLVDTFDFYILPVANPDGYEYSHRVDRLWRKSRSRLPHMDRRRCRGVDLNRNFNHQWMSDCDPTCDSQDPCHITYAGPEPFSEPESRAISRFLLDHKDQIKLFFTLHSYSQLLLYPWGYTKTPPRDKADLAEVAYKAVVAMRRAHGSIYIPGSPARILYAAGGSSFDWAKAEAGIKYTYTIELRDRGRYGFLLPENQIVPTGQEAWAAIEVALESISPERSDDRLGTHFGRGK